MIQRLFIALELPLSVRETLMSVQAPIGGVRWLGIEQPHLTLAFLGEVETENHLRLEERLGRIGVPPFVLPVCGVGTFGRHQPKVIWAGVGTGHPHLFALHQHVTSAALGAGIPLDLKSWRPHVTLARARNVSAESLRPFLREHGRADFGFMEVDRFSLFSSELHADGSRYRRLQSWPLAA